MGGVQKPVVTDMFFARCWLHKDSVIWSECLLYLKQTGPFTDVSYEY